MQKKKRLTADEKVMILREYLENNTQISELSEKYGVQPSQVYTWKKQMFESASEIFSGKHKNRKKGPSPEEVKIKKLEETLRTRESLISEIVADNMVLRKELDGPD